MALKRTIWLLILFGFVTAGTNKPCASRQISGKSVVCVCNATYCDEIYRQVPDAGKFVAYTSSAAGSRFEKLEGELQNFYSWNEGASHTLEIDPTKTSQTIEGFGGAVTDSAGIHWYNMSASVKDRFINSYFAKNGIEYNMVRVPIGGSDFSTHNYAYNELPENDTMLTNYTLSPEDLLYKIPMIQHINKVATDAVHIVATVWSPPSWMKTEPHLPSAGYLLAKYYQTFVDYMIKFIREYRKFKIEVWGLTTTNEPIDAFAPGFSRFQHLGWTPDTLGKWIVNNLGPTFKNTPDLQHINILAIDDQRLTIPLYFNVMISDYPKVLDYIDGVALHWYTDKFVPPSFLELITKKHPTKFVISTEACEGSFPWQKEKVSLGDWSRAESYIDSIIQDLNYDLVGWIDWNLVLDKQGGPNWVKNFVDSPVIVVPENQEFWKQPMFYAMGHFSKWIPRGSIRLAVKEKKGLLEKSVDHVAFLTPRKTIVLVVQNKGDARRVRVQIGEDHAILPLETASVTTFETPYQQ